MKYIMFRLGDQLVPVLFPPQLNHKDVANGLTSVLNLSKLTVVSAGMVEGLACIATVGQSITLGVPALSEDACHINVYPYCAGQDTGQEVRWERLVLMAQANSIAEKYTEDT